MAECVCTDEFISSYWLTPRSTIPGKILEFDYSYGYNCKRLFNLCLIDPDVLVFNSGNFIHFFRISTKEMTFRRSASGGGIGFILKNPNPKYNYLTIAENGSNPKVIISKFPEHKIISLLENGARFTYTCAQYRPDGELLATQSGEPDYMITIWEWQKSQIILRTKSFQNDVICVLFSPYNDILLTTSGLTHIKFWKMANTFTGLKLQGDLGRFGKTEFSDIYAIYPMFDESVISSCEWGNMLVWDDGLIKIEVCRKNRKSCHTAPITLITMDEDEIMTAGMDGYVRIWFWETVELANPPDDDRFVEIEPIFEFYVGDKESYCEIKCLIKVEPDNKDDSRYYAQDGKGGIWFCDLNKDKTPEPSRKIFSCHGGVVISAGSSPISSHIATLGKDGYLNFYDYENHLLVLQKKFAYPGTDMIWLPTTVDPSGLVIIVSFNDGVLRQIVVKLKNIYGSTEQSVFLIDVIKAHTSSITRMSMNPKGTILVTGSKDKTIFIHQLKYEGNKNGYVQIIPIGFLPIPSFPTAMNWKGDENTVVIACSLGEIIEFEDLPSEGVGTNITYLLTDISTKKFEFKSIKSAIRLQIKINAKLVRLEAKRQKKLAELRKLKESNPGMEIDENMTFDDSEEEEEEPPLYIPPVPNTIFWLQYTAANTIWISIGGYDAGYIYEIQFGLEKPIRSTIIADGDDVEIYSYLYIENYMIVALQGGLIRINVVKEDYLDLSDYWLMGMHDNLNARVSKIFTSHDCKYLFTTGYDGNIFAYKWNGPKVIKPKSSKDGKYIKPTIVDDMEDSMYYLSLEQEKMEALANYKMKLSNEHKDKVLKIIAQYRIEFKQIIKSNKAIVESQQFTQTELELDERITEDFKVSLKDQLALVRRKLEFEVEKSALGKQKVLDYFIKPLEQFQCTIQGIRNPFVVQSFKINRLSDEIEDTKREIEERIKLLRGDAGTIEALEEQGSLDMSIPAPPEETFFLGQDPNLLVPRFNKQMQRLLFRYRARKQDQMKRYVDWEKIKYKKPDNTKNHINDIRAISEAERTIGDYKLKTDPEYVPKATNNTLYKYRELIRVREQLFDLKNDFNNKLFELRKEKQEIYNFIKKQKLIMIELHKKIPIKNRKEIPEFLPINIKLEYPEENLKELVKCGTGIEVEHFFISESLDQTNVHINNHTNDNIIIENPLKDLEWMVLNPHLVEKLPEFDELFELLGDPEQFDSKNILKFLKYADDSENATPWEIELRYRLIIDSVMQQEYILSDINDRVEKFEQDLTNLNDTKIDIQKRAKFLEIFLLTLNEELGILKDCERLENALIYKAETALTARNQFVAKITETTKHNEEIKKSNEKWIEQIKVIQTNFMLLIKGNKFFDFLRRIFKKKYRPPKEAKDDSESESESESSSSEEEEEVADDKSEDEDMAPIRLDEEFCPAGCDVKLYDLAFSLRRERHALESNIYTQNKIFDDKKKEMDEMKLQLKAVETVFLNEKKNLIDFRRQKQQFLNKVETLIVVNMDQLQYLKNPDDSVNDIDSTLLFNSDMVVQLHTRVGQLNLDTVETKRLHRINIVHLQKMTTDCTHMQRQINILEDEINQAMLRKFGSIIDIDELEESTLRRYIYETQTTLDELRHLINKQLAQKKEILVGLEKELCREMQIRTEKINILTVLQEEKNFLSELLHYQKKLIEKDSSSKKHIDFRHDLKKLQDIQKHQTAQIEFLEREIRTLKLKSKPLQVQTIESTPSLKTDTFEKFDETAQPPDADQYLDDDFKNLQLSALQFGPDVYTTERINKIVQLFLIKYLGKHMSEDSIRNYTIKIGKYLGYLAKNTNCDKIDDVLNSIVDNFNTIIPKKYMLHISSENIKDLFKDCIQVFCYEKIEVDVLEVISGIVANSIEVTSNVNEMNLTQELLLEIFKEIIEVLSVEDIQNPKTLDTLSNLVITCPRFDVRCINVIKLVENVMQHAKENLIDEFTQKPIRDAVDGLLERLKNKQKPKPKPTTLPKT